VGDEAEADVPATCNRELPGVKAGKHSAAGCSEWGQGEILTRSFLPWQDEGS